MFLITYVQSTNISIINVQAVNTLCTIMLHKCVIDLVLLLCVAIYADSKTLDLNAVNLEDYFDDCWITTPVPFHWNMYEVCAEKTKPVKRVFRLADSNNTNLLCVYYCCDIGYWRDEMFNNVNKIILIP